jgi:hypothetical protein
MAGEPTDAVDPARTQWLTRSNVIAATDMPFRTDLVPFGVGGKRHAA